MKPLFPLLVLYSVLQPQALAQITAQRRVSAPGGLLDDYEVTAPGTLSISLGVFYTRVNAGDDRAFPTADLSLGLSQRVDLNVSTSLTKSRFERFGTTAPGDSYLSAKFVVLPEGRRRPGVSFEPILEVLGRPSLANNALSPNKVNAVFGGLVGKSFNSFRIYNHSGYFTRGIFFSSAALELGLFSRLIPTAYLTFGALTANRDVAASLENNSSRADLGGTLGFRLSQNWTGYVGAGRNIGRRDVNSSRYHVAGGVSYTWKLWETK